MPSAHSHETVDQAVGSENPLPACPDTPNCERRSRRYDASVEALFAAAQQALDDLTPVELRIGPGTGRATAVYRVGLIFKDDVVVLAEPAEEGSILHVRSASRIGYSDLGVNRWRVRRFWQALATHLPDGEA